MSQVLTSMNAFDQLLTCRICEDFLADDDRLVTPGALPNRWVIGGLQTDVEDMRGLMTLADNPSRQGRRELRINEEVHAGSRTAWSD